MTRSARAVFAVLSVLGGALLPLAPGCSLDWAVRPGPGDAAAPETTRPDVTVGDTGFDAPDTGADAEPDANPCLGLAAGVASARAKAKECKFGTAGQCTTTIKDECDCDLVVRAAASMEDMKYATAIAAFVAQGCPRTPACGACPQLGNMVSWTCGGTGTCFP